MGILTDILGKKLWTSKETTTTSSQSESGKRKTTTKETTTERDSDGNTVSKITKTEETGNEQ